MLLSGCTTMVRYNPDYITQDLPTFEGVYDGKALVVTSIEDDNKIYSQKPSSFTGSANTIQLKLGNYIKNIAVEVLSQMFREGADHSTEIPESSDYRIIIEPKINSFDYKYNQLKNLGFAITPETQVVIDVTLFDSSGNLLLEKTYDSGLISTGTYVASLDPPEKINSNVHSAMYNLMLEATADIEQHL